MKKTKIRCKYFFTILLFIAVFASCKRNEELGIEVQPQEDIITVGFDNNGVVAYSVRDDSIRCDEALVNLMGSYFDPVMGTNTAGFYAQFRLPSNNVTFGTNPALDSISLTLAYNGGYYGDISTRQTVHVYEVLEDFYKDSIYYSNKRLYCSGLDLSGANFIPHPADSVISGSSHYAPHLRLRLDNSLGQKFIAASAGANLADNTSFLQFFKGLYVVAEPLYVNGAMIYFNLLNTQSKLTLYYHNDDADSLSYSFVINENSARVNTFDHLDYAGSDISFQHQIAGDTALGNDRLYLQAMAGIMTYIRFPNLRNLLTGGNIAINKAELIITPDPAMKGSFNYPEQLTLVKIEKDGTLNFLPDQFYGTNYFGGSYNSTTGEYRFNIAAYVQKILLNADYEGKGLYLAISGAAVKGDRLIIYGPGKDSGNLRLEISYTHLN